MMEAFTREMQDEFSVWLKSHYPNAEGSAVVALGDAWLAGRDSAAPAPSAPAVSDEQIIDALAKAGIGWDDPDDPNAPKIKFLNDGDCDYELRVARAVLALSSQAGKREDERIKQDNLEGMAECMDMFRRDMIEAGIIDDSVPPMFMTEAILGYIGKLNAKQDLAEGAGQDGGNA